MSIWKKKEGTEYLFRRFIFYLFIYSSVVFKLMEQFFRGLCQLKDAIVTAHLYQSTPLFPSFLPVFTTPRSFSDPEGRDLKRQRKKRVDFPIKEALLLTFIQQRNYGFDHCQPQVLSWDRAQSQLKIKIFYLVLRFFFFFFFLCAWRFILQWIWLSACRASLFSQ